MIKYFLLVIQLCIALTISAQANIKYTSANLNLRLGPDMSAKVITVIPKGTVVSIAENCDCEWILVSYNDIIGYVYSKYLISKETINSETKIYK